jgi:hypothetical protein
LINVDQSLRVLFVVAFVVPAAAGVVCESTSYGSRGAGGRSVSRGGPTRGLIPDLD